MFLYGKQMCLSESISDPDLQFCSSNTWDRRTEFRNESYTPDVILCVHTINRVARTDRTILFIYQISVKSSKNEEL